MSANVNPETGLRYGVISFNSLQPWCLDDLFHGPNTVDLSYQAAYEEAKVQAKRGRTSSKGRRSPRARPTLT